MPMEAWYWLIGWLYLGAASEFTVLAIDWLFLGPHLRSQCWLLKQEFRTEADLEDWGSCSSKV